MVQTVAMEVFLGLLPLSVIIEAEAQAGILQTNVQPAVET